MGQSDKRVVVIGAGMAGRLAGIKLQEAGFTDIAIYEKADSVGGTWLVAGCPPAGPEFTHDLSGR